MQTAEAISVASPAVDDAFADLVTLLYDDALRLAWLLAGDQHRAEDAVGEALARMLRRWRRQPIDNPRAYLRRAVVNEVNSSFRRLLRDRRNRERHIGEDRGARGAEEQIADAAQIAWALSRLPDRQRTAVVLFYYEELSQQETAEVMGCSVGTVKSNVSRGLDRMRALLDGEVE